MTKSPLRTYINEIEILVNDGRHEEAISDCQNILKSFPKNIATYKLLAQAYLETKQYAHAKDISQRVLSTIPDDFSAHIALNEIFENENDLHQAVWHMERAYETQPGNTESRADLTRLYEKRDGVSPQKVRLTGAALIRLYIKGELYQQAISEIHSTLAQDKSRIDLKVLLSYACLKTGASAEAVDTSVDILRDLPYCLEANRIMWIVLSDNEREDEAQIYLSRLEEIDPYYQFVNTPFSIPGNIAESAVTIERFKDMNDSISATSPPEQILEPEVETNVDKEIPEGLQVVEPENEITAELEESSSEGLHGSDESMKDDMQPTQFTDWQEEYYPDSLIDGDTQPVRVAPSSEPETETSKPVEGAKNLEPDMEGISKPEEASERVPGEEPVSPETENLKEKLSETGETTAPQSINQGEKKSDSQMNADEDEVSKIEIPDWLKELTQENDSDPDESESFLNSDIKNSINKPQLDQSAPKSDLPDWLKNQSES